MLDRLIAITLALSIVCLSPLNAQMTAAQGKSFPDRGQQPERITKLAKQRKLDVFNERRFKPFLFAEANYGVFGSFSRDEAFTVSAPVSLGLGMRLSPVWSVGLRAGQSVYNSDMHYYDRTFETRTQTRLRIVNANVNAHFSIGLRGEAYGGLNVGYQNTDVTALEASPKTGDDRSIVRPQNGLLVGGQIGVRYSLTPQLSVQSELTSGLSNFNVGIRFRLR